MMFTVAATSLNVVFEAGNVHWMQLVKRTRSKRTHTFKRNKTKIDGNPLFTCHFFCYSNAPHEITIRFTSQKCTLHAFCCQFFLCSKHFTFAIALTWIALFEIVEVFYILHVFWSSFSIPLSLHHHHSSILHKHHQYEVWVQWGAHFMSKIFRMKTKLPANKMCLKKNVFRYSCFFFIDLCVFFRLALVFLLLFLAQWNEHTSMNEHTSKLLNKNFDVVRIEAVAVAVADNNNNNKNA